MAEANETLPVLTSDLFAWIPRWRDKLVLEAWSLGTFMRMDWAEKHQAEEAAKTKQANKEEWQAKQELHQKALRQEHNALHKSAREHTAHVRAVSEERTQQVAKVEGQTIEQTLLVQQAMAQKLLVFVTGARIETEKARACIHDMTAGHIQVCHNQRFADITGCARGLASGVFQIKVLHSPQ